MQVKIRNIQQRGNSFFFRLTIPKDLQVHYNGQKEISKTLETSDAFFAFTRASELRATYKEQFRLLRSGEPLPTEEKASLPSPVVLEPTTVIPSAPLLSEILEEVFLARPCKYKTGLDRKSAIRLLSDWHGDLPVDQYTRKMLLEFRDKGMLRLPTNVYKEKTYLDQSLRSLAREKHATTMTPRTVNNKLCHISTVFNYARKHGYSMKLVTVSTQRMGFSSSSPVRCFFIPSPTSTSL